MTHEPRNSPRGRTDPQGRAFKGSMLQTQLWVNCRQGRLDAELVAAMPELDGATLRWVSPLAGDAYLEYQDGRFLQALGLDQAVPAEALGAFWPSGGPVWDALAAVTCADGQPGALLVEGKSYPKELYGSGCKAEAASSRELIEAALAETQVPLQVDVDPARWMGSLYQTANRLAHLRWLREQLDGRAWFAHLLFTGDPHGPTTPEEWKASLDDADRELGLTSPVPGAFHVLLEAGDRQELVDATS